MKRDYRLNNHGNTPSERIAIIRNLLERKVEAVKADTEGKRIPDKLLYDLCFSPGPCAYGASMGEK